MTIQEYENTINAYPTLTTHGFGVDTWSKASFNDERAKLFTYYNEALVCEEFLNLCKRTKNPQKVLGSSYKFKHYVERYASRQGKSVYIPEGALVTVALYLGFNIKPKEDTTSVYLNVSRKTKIQDRLLYAF